MNKEYEVNPERKIQNKVWEFEKLKTYDGTIGLEYTYSINDVMIIEIATMEDYFELNIRSSSEQPLESIKDFDKEYFMIYDKEKFNKEFSKNGFSLEEVMTIGLAKANMMGWPIDGITYSVAEI